MQDDLRAELIKQFPAEAVEITEADGKKYYVCPSCKRMIALADEKCGGCNQVLSWDHIHKQEMSKGGMLKATLSFEVPGDFVKGDCRKCPLSYIAKEHSENVYECPLKMRTHCSLEIS